jgi:hypothetical protein
MRKIAVNQNGLALKYISPEHQTDELCVSAIKNNYTALKYVNKQTFKICMLALYKSDGKNSIVKMIKNPEINIYCEILKKYPSEMQYVCLNDDNSLKQLTQINKTIDLLGSNCGCLRIFSKMESEEHLFSMCVKRNGMHIKYIKPQKLTYNLCSLAVKNNGLALQYIPLCFHNETLCLLALKQDVKAIEFIKPNMRTTEMWTLALKKDGTLIKFLSVDDFSKYNIQSDKILEIIKILLHIAISQNKDAIMYTISTPICKLLIDLNKSSKINENLALNETKEQIKETNIKEDNLQPCEYLLITNMRNKSTIKEIIPDNGGTILLDCMIDKLLSFGVSKKYISLCIQRLADEMTIQDYINRNLWGYHFVKINNSKYSIVRVGHESLEAGVNGLRYDDKSLWSENNGIITLNKKFIRPKVMVLYKFEVIQSK